MSMQNLLNQFMGSGTESANTSSITNAFKKITSNMPGGLMGGAAAGGIMALLMSNKKARKLAGTAASFGGAAVIGGLAYKAYKSWQHNNSDEANTQQSFSNYDAFRESTESIDIDLLMIKAMIAAAKADGHIDALEQQRIFKTIEQMELSSEMKAIVFDLLNKPIDVNELSQGVYDLTLKSEVYLASCLVINNDHPSEQAHLNKLAAALELPQGLVEQIQAQAEDAIKQVEHL